MTAHDMTKTPSPLLLQRSKRQHQKYCNSIATVFYILFGLMVLLWISLQYSIERIHHRNQSGISGNVLPQSTPTFDGASSSTSPYQSSVRNITTIAQARRYQLKSIASDPIHTSRYTIRMNTWRRNEQLLLSLNHHAKCEGVAQIQLIWCDTQNPPPDEISNHSSGKVQIEYHTINSLNERFHILNEPPTLGILSLDDDILRPCEALDATFIRWTRHPERIVGFDSRSHRIDRKLDKGSQQQQMNDGKESSSQYTEFEWEYGMVGSSNEYSITLPSKACFIHRDYLDLYTAMLPQPIYNHISKHFECEDIAMSYLVSTLTHGKPPLLSDYWAYKSELELYSRGGISWTEGHLDSRNVCVNDFAEHLGLKERRSIEQGGGDDEVHPLQFGNLNRDWFCGYGAEPERCSEIDAQSFSHVPRLQQLILELQRRESLSGQDLVQNSEWTAKLRTDMEGEAKAAGLVKGTIEWKLRWLFNCATELNYDDKTKHCFGGTKPRSTTEGSSFFVCDISDGVLHHVGNTPGDWMIAGPPKGTGVHEYAAFVGDPPCKNIGRCHGCLSPKGNKLCSVIINPEDCSIEVGKMQK